MARQAPEGHEDMSHHAVAPFVVTGMPRSGTTYTAAVLTRLGLDCGHEEVFHPATTHYEGMGRWDGDASWLAVPFLADLPQEVRVVHLVRHPLRVAGSLVGTRFLEPASWVERARDDMWATTKWRIRGALVRRGHLDHVTASPRPTSAFQDFLRHHLSGVWEEPTPIKRALRFWLEWNRLVAAAPQAPRSHRLRIEDFNPDAAQQLAGFIGLPVTAESASLAVGKVPANLNQRARIQLKWSDIPPGVLADEVACLADDLGYSPSDVLWTPEEG